MIYVDNFDLPFRNLVLCRVIADSAQELREAIKILNFHEEYIRWRNTIDEYLMVSPANKKTLLANDAIEITTARLTGAAISHVRVEAFVMRN